MVHGEKIIPLRYGHSVSPERPLKVLDFGFTVGPYENTDYIEPATCLLQATLVQIGLSSTYDMTPFHLRDGLLRSSKSKTGSRFDFGEDKFAPGTAFVWRRKTDKIDFRTLKSIIPVEYDVSVLFEVGGSEILATISK